MAIKLSPNPTCVLSDADNLTLEQRQKINLNLTKDIPGSDIEGDKVTVINSEGEVEMKAYSAGGGGGTEYTAGDGIDITSDTISAKVDNSTIGVNASGQLESLVESTTYTAGNGIDITSDVISTKIDGTTITLNASGELQASGGGEQPLPAIPAYSIRFKFSDTSFDPSTPLAVTNGTWSVVDADSGIWDFTYQNSDWTELFMGVITGSNVNGTVDIIGGNMSGVTTAIRLFRYCDSLVNVRIVSPWGDGNTDPNLSNMLEGSGATEIYIDMSGSNMPNGNPFYSYMAHESPSLRKFTLKNTGAYPSLDHILHDCFALREATIEGFEEIGNAEAMFTSAYNLVKITLTPTQSAINVGTNAESMFYRTGSAVETIEYPFDLASCNSVRGMFAQCKISQLPVLLNTAGVENFSSFCDSDTELRSIPYIDVSYADNVESMFSGCSKVQSGALDLYKQLSTGARTYYSSCFNNCGIDTVSGKIELAKIPTSYGGLGYESASTASVTLSVNDLVVNDSVDVTSITVDSGVTNGIVQWTVDSSTTLPTVVDGNNNALIASVNNPSSLTVGRTVQISILNGTWTCSEFA